MTNHNLINNFQVIHKKIDNNDVIKSLKLFFDINFSIKFISLMKKCLKIPKPNVIEKIKEGLQKKARERYQYFPEEQKNKKQEYCCK